MDSRTLSLGAMGRRAAVVMVAGRREMETSAAGEEETAEAATAWQSSCSNGMREAAMDIQASTDLPRLHVPTGTPVPALHLLFPCSG